MRFFFDTEFYEDGRTIELISIGIVAEDGREYYAETPNAQSLAGMSPWLIANVLPKLCGCIIHGKPRELIAKNIIDFVGERPEFWAYYADYDWVVLCQLYGRMIDLPHGWPMYCKDVKQVADALGNHRLPPQDEGVAHDALADARWCKLAYAALRYSELCKAVES